MKLIIPMAGMGKRLHPHTLRIPKPLLKTGGKSIVEWIIKYFTEGINKEFSEIHFVIGNFGKDVEEYLISIAGEYNCKGFIHYQKEALGTAHAIYCAKQALEGNVLIAFADTLFQGNFKIEDTDESIIYTMKVVNPEQYGVVKTGKNNVITDFIEKPKDFVSDNAIIGIYYFKNGELLRNDIKRLIDNKLMENNEYQLTNCLESLKNNGLTMVCKNIDEWLDCGNRNELLKTNKRILEINNYKYNGAVNKVSESATINNSQLNYCYIEQNCDIENCTLVNCIVYENTKIVNCNLRDTIIGSNSNLIGLYGKGDFSEKTYYEKN